jgi:deoxyribonuclease-4
MRLGAHLSTAGGLHTAFPRGEELGCTAIQIFLSSPRQWRGRDLSEEDVAKFRAAWRASECKACFAHDIYLTRLGSRDRTIRRKSRSLDAVLEEADGDRTPILLETTAGQGSDVGHRFEQLGRIVEKTRRSDRIGVCLDTCHVFAAGYDISTGEGYVSTLEAFDREVGLDRLKVIHLNDSRRPLGSRVDRHTHIGEGQIGEAAFGWILRDRRLARLPKLIETPKEGGMDRVNLERLRRLSAAA